MYRKTLVVASAILALAAMVPANAADRRLKITRQYLNFPVSHSVDRQQITFTVDGRQQCRSVIRLAEGQPDYWTFQDMSQWRGKTVTLHYDGPQAALNAVVQADSIYGAANMYHEPERPQYHFTTRRGWINDPNGCVFYNGKYHLFYQHNPFERDWENMHWGHAVSTDLTHWQELPDALHPDGIGTMFSGSAVIDYDNTAGYNRKGKPAMVAFYTADSREAQRQCMAYSLDEGRTFTKYDGNPIIDSHEKWQSHDTRDPRVFWYAPGKHWVLVLNERDGHTIYNSTDMKHWTPMSHLTGFWECPDLFELPVEGTAGEKRWVMWGASGTYMVGDFDGKRFTPLTTKQQNVGGSAYAAQTFTNIPESDGRTIKMTWGRLNFGKAPFNGVMLLPQEQVLQRTAFGGYQLLSRPVREVDDLFVKAADGKDMTVDEANALLARFSGDVLRIRLKLQLTYATDAGLRYCGKRLLDYDMNGTRVNGTFYATEKPGSMILDADIYVDRSVVEVFVDGGRFSDSFSIGTDTKNTDGYKLWGNALKVKSIEVDTLK